MRFAALDEDPAVLRIHEFNEFLRSRNPQRPVEGLHVPALPSVERGSSAMKFKGMLFAALMCGVGCSDPFTGQTPTELSERLRDAAPVDGAPDATPPADQPMGDVQVADGDDVVRPDVPAPDAADGSMPSDADDAAVDVTDGGAPTDRGTPTDTLDVPTPDVPVDMGVPDTGVDVPAPMDVTDGGAPTDRGDTDAGTDAPTDEPPAADVPDAGPADTGMDVPVDTGPICPIGQRACTGGVCRAIATDLANCGACDRTCPSYMSATSTCVSGVCGFTCNTGFASCDSDDGNGCETNTRTSAAHCGMCNRACASGSVCVDGVCTAMCSSPRTQCGMDCVDTSTNVAHCGRCDNACAFANAASVCMASTCVIGTCNTGFGDCDGNALNGCEADLRISRSNCGRCGTSCPSPANAVSACTSSVCGFTCNTGFGDCDTSRTNGCETNTSTSALHCGACGNACASGVCAAGVCAPLVMPVFEIVYQHAEITGIRARIVNGSSPNYVGAFVDNPCLPPISSGRRSCRIDLRRLQIPNSETPSALFTSTGDWRGGYGIEGIFLGAGGAPVCTGSDCRLPGGTVCGAGTAFSCASVLCNASASPMNSALIRYEMMYRGAGYGFRIAGSDLGLLVCPTS